MRELVRWRRLEWEEVVLECRGGSRLFVQSEEVAPVREAGPLVVSAAHPHCFRVVLRGGGGGNDECLIFQSSSGAKRQKWLQQLHQCIRVSAAYDMLLRQTNCQSHCTNSCCSGAEIVDLLTKFFSCPTTHHAIQLGTHLQTAGFIVPEQLTAFANDRTRYSFKLHKQLLPLQKSDAVSNINSHQLHQIYKLIVQVVTSVVISKQEETIIKGKELISTLINFRIAGCEDDAVTIAEKLLNANYLSLSVKKSFQDTEFKMGDIDSKSNNLQLGLLNNCNETLNRKNMQSSRSNQATIPFEEAASDPDSKLQHLAILYTIIFAFILHSLFYFNLGFLLFVSMTYAALVMWHGLDDFTFKNIIDFMCYIRNWCKYIIYRSICCEMKDEVKPNCGENSQLSLGHRFDQRNDKLSTVKLFDSKDVSPKCNSNFERISADCSSTVDDFRNDLLSAGYDTMNARSFFSDSYLQGVLSVQNRSYAYALDKIKRVLQWRAKNRIADLKIENFDKQLKSGSMYWYGYDKFNNPILWVRPDLKDWKKMDRDKEVMAHVLLLERGCTELMVPGHCTFTIVADSSKIGFQQIDIRLMKSLLSVLLANYPDRIGKIYVGPVNLVVKTLIRILLPAFPSRLKDKLVFMRKPQHELILTAISEAEVPLHMGGTNSHQLSAVKNDEFDFDYMMLRQKKMLNKKIKAINKCD